MTAWLLAMAALKKTNEALQEKFNFSSHEDLMKAVQAKMTKSAAGFDDLLG